jgi:hypothetical protein
MQTLWKLDWFLNKDEKINHKFENILICEKLNESIARMKMKILLNNDGKGKIKNNITGRYIQ